MKGLAAAIAAVAALPALSAMPANAVSIELRDVAADRIERQRRAAEGNLPLPDTPDLGRFAERLAEKGMKAGAPILIRIFKAESELEVWMRAGNSFRLLDVYPVCHWSGTIGPKIHEGDKQTPEEAREAEDRASIAVVPLGLPLLAGPGAMSTILIYASEKKAIPHVAAVCVVAIAVALATWLTLHCCSGQTGL